MAPRLTVLAWHNVEGTWCWPARPGAGARGLERQLRRVRRLANVVALEPALEALAAGDELPPRAVALTWDDGYRDVLDLALPLLERLDLPATFFLVPGLLSRQVRPWWELLGWAFAHSTRGSVAWEGRDLPARGRGSRRAYRWLSGRLALQDRAARERAMGELLDRLAPSGRPGDQGLFMDWDGAAELVRRGFSVGSHSTWHAILSREAPDEQLRDLTGSRQELEGRLQVPVRLLAYPSGQPADYDHTTLRAAEQAGYAHALTTEAGWNSPSTPALEAHRIVLDPHRTFTTMAAARLAARARRA